MSEDDKKRPGTKPGERRGPYKDPTKPAVEKPPADNPRPRRGPYKT